MLIIYQEKFFLISFAFLCISDLIIIFYYFFVKRWFSFRSFINIISHLFLLVRQDIFIIFVFDLLECRLEGSSLSRFDLGALRLIWGVLVRGVRESPSQSRSSFPIIPKKLQKTLSKSLINLIMLQYQTVIDYHFSTL